MAAATRRAPSAYMPVSRRRGTSAAARMDGTWPDRGGEAGADGGDVVAVDHLVEGEERRNDLRDTCRQGAHGRPEPAVAEHRGGVGEHGVLREPLQDMGIARQWPQPLGIDLTPDGHQDAEVEVREGVQCLAEDSGERRYRACDRAERDIEQGALRVTPLRVGARR